MSVILSCQVTVKNTLAKFEGIIEDKMILNFKPKFQHSLKTWEGQKNHSNIQTQLFIAFTSCYMKNKNISNSNHLPEI